jgi:hypothetical protein
MSEQRTMTAAESVKTFNEWMRRYIDEPERYSREFQTVQDFLTDESAGVEPSYGETCMAYQFLLRDEMDSAPRAL